jgi:hypothetical protein
MNWTLAGGTALKSFTFTWSGVRAEWLFNRTTYFAGIFLFSNLAPRRISFLRSWGIGSGIQPLSRKQDAMKSQSYGRGKCVLFDVFHLRSTRNDG